GAGGSLVSMVVCHNNAGSPTRAWLMNKVSQSLRHQDQPQGKARQKCHKHHSHEPPHVSKSCSLTCSGLRPGPEPLQPNLSGLMKTSLIQASHFLVPSKILGEAINGSLWWYRKIRVRLVLGKKAI